MGCFCSKEPSLEMRGKRCQCCKEKYDDPDEVLADPNDSSQSCQKSLRVNLQAGDSPLDHGVEVDINSRAEVGGSDQSSPVYFVPTNQYNAIQNNTN